MLVPKGGRARAGADGARLAETVTTLMAAAGQDKDAVITTLQAELGATTTRLHALETEGKRSRAEAFVDGAIAARNPSPHATSEALLLRPSITSNNSPARFIENTFSGPDGAMSLNGLS